jgi:hypothetical protein
MWQAVQRHGLAAVPQSFSLNWPCRRVKARIRECAWRWHRDLARPGTIRDRRIRAAAGQPDARRIDRLAAIPDAARRDLRESRGGAPVLRGILRVTFWDVAAMLATYLIGKLFGTAVA